MQSEGGEHASRGGEHASKGGDHAIRGGYRVPRAGEYALTDSLHLLHVLEYLKNADIFTPITPIKLQGSHIQCI